MFAYRFQVSKMAIRIHATFFIWIWIVVALVAGQQVNVTDLGRNDTAERQESGRGGRPVHVTCQIREQSARVTCSVRNDTTCYNVSLPASDNDLGVEGSGGGDTNTSSAPVTDGSSTEVARHPEVDQPNVTSLVLDPCGLFCFNLSLFSGVSSVRLVNATRLAAHSDCSDPSQPEGVSRNETKEQNETQISRMISRLSLLPSIRHLDLSDNDIDDMVVVCTDHVSNVTELDLSDNRVSTFQLNALWCLPRLRHLDLSHNVLTDVEVRPTLGRYPADVRHLNLSYNLIRALPRDVLSFFDQLVVLDLSYNLLATIDPYTFSCRLRHVEWLSLADNQILMLGESAFAGLSDIKHLNLSGNQLESIDGRSFARTPAGCVRTTPPSANGTSKSTPTPTPPIGNWTTWSLLDTVDLSSNNISVVEKSWFHSAIANCRVILLSHNRIRHFPRYGLERLPRLERLSLDDNALYWLDVGTFTSRTLKYINLARNKLKKIISMTFLFLPDIQTVDLSYNELNFIYRVAFYKSCKHNQRFRVDLSHNYLTEDVTWALVTSFRHLIATECVVDLIVQHNRLRGILGNAKHIYGRHLRLMDAAYFTVWDHVTLDVRDNPMRCDCELANDVTLLTETGKLFAGGNVSSAHHLDFWRHVQCEPADGRRAWLPLPEALDSMTCTSLLRCPYECTCYFDKVTVVNCTRRSLIAIPYDLPPGEKRVYMAENYIMELEDGPFLENVTYLDLSSNALIDVEPEALLRLAPTATLLLHNNVLSQIPSTVGRLERAGHLTLRGNPISCACENWWFVDWLTNHTDVVTDFDNVTCDNGRHIPELDPDVVLAACDGSPSSSLFHGRSASVLYASLAAALALGFLCLIIVTLVIHSRRRILPVLMNRLSWYRINLDRDSTRDEIVLWYSPLDELWVKNNLVDAIRRGLPLNAVCPYHQCLVEAHELEDPASDDPECGLRSFASAKCVVVVLSENFLATEWPSAADEWQSQPAMANPILLLAEGCQTPAFFLSIEPIKLAEHRQLCDVIKLHAFYDVSEVMWLESLLDAISSLDASHESVGYNVDWTDDENLALRTEKH